MKKLYHHIAALLVLAGSLLAGHSGGAQVFNPNNPTNPNDPTGRTPAAILADTTERRDPVVTPEAKRSKAAADSAKRTERMFRAFGYQGIRLTRPGKAALLATILPGAGQIYNRRWWKLPVVYGALGGVVGAEIFWQRRFTEFSDAYDLVTANPKLIGSQSLSPRARLYTRPDGIKSALVYYRGNRDIFYLYIGLAYGLQIVDALVDAHLKDFDVSDDLAVHWQPTLLQVPGQGALLPFTPGLQVALRVK
ncbi:DUF5683 domain-containing protein [Hymenobacter armeniacus]|uniref:DUF5683 domain-containing protein n=1 Tax=Hymenobacter armeniacus TaxID=2771358 RepID=A0ABR8K0W2_9BACT|nr:DUF5683 domain-containing protein [Hymenobacter armeniacus]MBD2724034.1 hypothetical protein [Hymenobacter armeniacus]